MRRTAFRSFAVISLAGALLFAAASTRSARRPRYGGTLRVEMRAQVNSLDPATMATNPAAAAAQEKLMALVFDTLTRLDDAGRPQPGLAASWSSSEDGKTWILELRSGVKFQDGTALSAGEVAPILRGNHPNWQVTGFTGEYGRNRSDSIQIVSEMPQPNLPAELAAARNAIVRRGADGAPIGTGPFRIAEWHPGSSAVFTANEDSWEGRPFIDSIEVQMGRAARDQLIDLEVGRADLVEIAPEQARRATERGARIWASAPVDLLALVFTTGRPVVEDARVREALAHSIDRGALANFLLQKQGEPAGGLLPQWSSGYAFLFSTAADPARARQIVSQISPVPPALVLGYDSSDALEQAVAERIAVNAHDAGIRVSTQALTAAQAANVDARVMRLRMASPDPRAALAEFVAQLASSLAPANAAPLPNPASPEDLYARERAVIEGFRIVPLVHLPEIIGLNAQVKDWMPLRWGGWRLADVWLDAPARSAPVGNSATGEKR